MEEEEEEGGGGRRGAKGQKSAEAVSRQGISHIKFVEKVIFNSNFRRILAQMEVEESEEKRKALAGELKAMLKAK